MSAIRRHIRGIMVVSGTLTATMIHAAIAPDAAMRATFGETLDGPLAHLVVRNWGALIGLVGVRLPGACFLAWEELRIPLMDLVLPAAGLGVAGAWWAMVTDVILRSILAAGRFVHGGWKRIRV